jgi:hypothetical protein
VDAGASTPVATATALLPPARCRTARGCPLGAAAHVGDGSTGPHRRPAAP